MCVISTLHSGVRGEYDLTIGLMDVAGDRGPLQQIAYSAILSADMRNRPTYPPPWHAWLGYQI